RGSRTCVECLVGMLDLDCCYAKLNDPSSGAPSEILRLAQPGNVRASTQEIGQVLNTWLRDDPHTSSLVVRNPVGDGDVSIAPFRPGLQDSIDVVVAGSGRANFPTA